MRVFVGPLEIAGVGQNLVDGLHGLGVTARLVCHHPHAFAYERADKQPAVVRLWQATGRWRGRAGRRFDKLASVVADSLAGLLVLAWAVLRFDAFVLLYGTTISGSLIDLRLLRLLRRRVCAVFVGSDARPPYLDGALFPANETFDVAAVALATKRQRSRVQRIERYADVVVNARATAHFHARRFVNWFALGIPRAAHPQAQAPDDGVVRVLHSPSHPVLKGTDRIRSVVETLRVRGIPIELRTISGRPNAEVIEALRDCHLVIDQLYSDTPMAAFATEAAAYGRAVVVGSVAAAAVAAQVAPLPVPPSVYIRPDELGPTLEALVADATRRERLGAAGAEYVARQLNPEAVAARLLRMLSGDTPAGWWCEPAEVSHVVGCGLTETAARARVQALIEHGGAAALGVAHNPALERRLVDFARGAAP
jgi:hypothetical protein